MTRDPPLATRLLLGGIAGFAATVPMTATIRLIHHRLPADERYPATPRELIDSAAEAVAQPLSENKARDLTLAAHFGFGAAAGALVTAALPRPSVPAALGAGVVVWAWSYLGWIPAAGLLKPATAHPARRNGMMLAAHLVWGGALWLALRELQADRATILAGGPGRDIPPPEPKFQREGS